MSKPVLIALSILNFAGSVYLFAYLRHIWPQLAAWWQGPTEFLVICYIMASFFGVVAFIAKPD